MTKSSRGHTPLSRMRFSWQHKELTEASVSEPSTSQDAVDPGVLGRSHGESSWGDAPPPTAAAEDAPGRSAAPSSAPGSGVAPLDREDYSEVRSRPPDDVDSESLEAPAADASTTRSSGVSSGENPDSGRRQQSRPYNAGGFDVPRPGSPFSGRRGLHVGLRSALVLTCCLVLLGTIGFGAYVYGTTAGDGSYTLSEGDVATYHLADFPVERAGQFAADYVRICLDHPDDDAAKEQRQEQLAQYSSAGVDPTCGWNGTGAQTVRDVAWTGESEAMDNAGYGDHARWFTVRALTSSGSRMVEVPVYVEDLTRGEGMRVVGDVGEVPQPVLAQVERPSSTATSDEDLAQALLDGEFFRQYFAAWGESDEASLQRLVSPDATTTARLGLSGMLVKPSIEDAMVFYPRDVEPEASDESFAWEVGATSQAWVWVTWQNPRVDEDTRSTRAYRVQLVKTADAANPAQEWAVRDIEGGIPDVDD